MKAIAALDPQRLGPGKLRNAHCCVGCTNSLFINLLIRQRYMLEVAWGFIGIPLQGPFHGEKEDHDV